MKYIMQIGQVRW